MKCPKCNFENPDNARFCGNCTAPLTPSEEISVPHTETLQTSRKELTTGSIFAGRYQVIEELGSGGMGKVYKVLDKDIKEKVALKLLNPEIVADKKMIERFGNELKFARKISHRNVCRMYDLGKEEGTNYITMEYVPGEDLRSTIRRIGQLPVGKSMSIAKQVCEGLAEAHGLGVVHRDLKPQNIMIDKEGNARIMDFGIARSLGTKGITGAGVMIGTPEYMSPEQVEGKEADQRSDIYSLGVTLYEMVTGQVPFEGETPLSIAVKHKTEAPRDPKQLNSQVPSDLSQIILKCMEKDRDKRYQSVENILSELIKIEEGIPTTERVLPKRKPLTTKEITVTFRLQKLFIPALVVIALAIVVAIIWKVLPRKEAVPIAIDKPSLAVMYFKNNTGDDSFDVWRSALSDSIITDLSQSKFIRVLSEDRLYSILRKLDLLETRSYASEDLKEVAAEGKVNHILQGSLSKAGDTFRIDYTLQEISTGETIGAERVEGIGESSIFSMVDELTRRVKANFKLSAEEIASDIDREVGKITTSSPEAFKYYSEGSKYHMKGERRKSISFMEKAVAIDPEFAMAYRRMAANYYNMGYGSESKKYLQKAFELSDRVSDRERYLIQGDFYLDFEKTHDKAIEAFNKLLELYPYDSIGNNNLGLLYLNLEQWDKAIERFEVNIQNKVEALHSYNNIAVTYGAKGLYDKAREVLEYYLNNISDYSSVRRRLAWSYVCQGKYDLALVEVDKAFSVNPADYYIFLMKGDIYSFKGDLIEAKKEYLKALEAEEQTAHLYGRGALGALYLLGGEFEKSKEQTKQGIELAEELGEVGWKSWFHWYLGYMRLKSGNPEKALEEFNKAWSIAVEEEMLGYQRVALWWKGLAYLEMKSMDEAQKAADELKKMIEQGMNQKLMRLYYNLVGMIELERENFTKAIEYLKKALSLLPAEDNAGHGQALFIEPLALTYYKAGNLEKAREEYERIISFTTGRAYYGDIFAKSFFMLGQIYEKKGWKGKAIEQYEKFLALWKDADPNFPEVEDAKKRLAALQKLP